ncbi:biotin--[acetyl-CoA-carboxylase] ligase [Cryomorpha ignava]|uniref:Biotin--[acetyl-CoA-carboxylase] ligase n=1 Tax=Cryomorpha ignava TaxID=101383 RepID=A0A7K3WL94_9FLAO|nr:biotin--[acetyl-CoA-carboxylase] ligase [Cryomorpha ignava]NEN22407.1 biotin--[acetyl-CoA-carboxylase] ligase [Cryomorpha ignava]
MIGNKITQFNSLDSTSNYVAKQLISGDYEEGDVILAHFQTEGRGQRGSFWQSVSGQNLTFSFALRSDFLNIHEHFIFSKAVSVAIYDLLCKRLKTDVSIKWPNDILVSDQKICGILLETKIIDSQKYTIFGLGLNVNQGEFPIGLKATSIALQLRESISVNEILTDLIRELNACLKPITDGYYDDIEWRYMNALYGAHEWINFTEENRSFYGKIREVDNAGVMLVKSKQGNALNYRTKEVTINY